ncbi:MAG: hypothetical protein GX053_12305 [Tissierella sp.]|nr:hypothetical protein [Tissierella sp.]
MSNCPWLPPLVIYESHLGWPYYENKLYEIFCRDFKESFPSFYDLRVNVRHHPIEFGKEEAFFHFTCQDYSNNNDRIPDFRRCERISWIRKFIENYNCNESCEICEGIKLWEKPYKNTFRVHLLFEKERYMVVVEKRESYYLLITAFYIEREHTLQKKLKEYNQYKDSKRRLL